MKRPSLKCEPSYFQTSDVSFYIASLLLPNHPREGLYSLNRSGFPTFTYSGGIHPTKRIPSNLVHITGRHPPNHPLRPRAKTAGPGPATRATTRTSDPPGRRRWSALSKPRRPATPGPRRSTRSSLKADDGRRTSWAGDPWWRGAARLGGRGSGRLQSGLRETEEHTCSWFEGWKGRGTGSEELDVSTDVLSFCTFSPANAILRSSSIKAELIGVL